MIASPTIPTVAPVPAASRRSARLVLRTTPGWLRLASAVVAGLALAAGVLCVFSASSRHSAADSALREAAPLVVNAQSLHSSLSDADTTVAGGFLAGAVIPATSQARYGNDLASAAAALRLVASESGGASGLAGSTQTLSVDLPLYAGIVQTALADNRQGFPVGPAYLAEANNLMRSTILPAASLLDAETRTQLNNDNDQARGSVALVITLVLLGITLVGLVVLQFRIARRFRRLLNLPMVLATVLVLAVGLWAILASTSERRALTRSQQQGVAPLGVLAQARTLAFQVRADDELTLVTRDAVASYQQDYTVTLGRLRTALSPGQTKNWTPAERAALAQASDAVDRYQTQHLQVRQADANGNLTQAIALDRSGAAVAAAQLDQVLSGGITSSVTSFDSAASSAADHVDGVGWWWLVLMALAALLVLVGVEPRIKEYR